MRIETCLLAGLLLLSGCASSPVPRYYTLNGAPEAIPLASAGASEPRIAVEAVTLPETVDRPQLVLQTGRNEVAIVQTQRWAEPLKTAIPRLLAERLARRLGNPLVAAYPQQASARAEYRVQVDIQRFEARLGKAVLVEALWTLRGPAGTVLASGRPVMSQAVDGGGHEDIVAAYSRALSSIADELADRLRELSNSSS